MTPPAFVELANGIHTVRVFTCAEAAAIIAQFAESPAWSNATVNADHAVDRALRDAEVFGGGGWAEEALSDAHTRLYAVTRQYAAALAPRTVLAEVQLVRYHPGGRYVDHRDSPAPEATPRALSLVVYLNDDFTGGATVFPEAECTVAPVAGMAVAFSPLLLHRAEAVTNGAKYVLTGWYHRLP